METQIKVAIEFIMFIIEPNEFNKCAVAISSNIAVVFSTRKELDAALIRSMLKSNNIQDI
ncbi:hypothetical protein MTR_7g070933 [Medicago truncatula]|uniref:Uncharacterized protein n=1 Tax=Medicago truncatula TaxID=3880 RepID=A0A072U1B8_MEDTR|nr:hypothetical protein MTR_7g070933 [Medicago truncatula]